MTPEAALDRMIEKLESRLARLRAELDSNDDLVTWERGRIEGLQVALEDAVMLRSLTIAEQKLAEPPASTEEAIDRAAGVVTPAGPVQSHAGERFEWVYSEIVDGGEKWRLVERNRHGDKLPIATLIRLPGSMTRIFGTDYAGNHYNVPSTSDHPTPCEARLALIELVGELPKLPNRSDEAHDHARLPGETIHEWNCRMGLA